MTTPASDVLVIALLLSGLGAVVLAAAVALTWLSRSARHSLPTRHGKLVVDPTGIHLVRDGREYTIYRARHDNGEF